MKSSRPLFIIIASFFLLLAFPYHGTAADSAQKTAASASLPSQPGTSDNAGASANSGTGSAPDLTPLLEKKEDTEQSFLSSMYDDLFQKRMAGLKELNSSIAEMWKQLPDARKNLQIRLSAIDQEYILVRTMMQVSKGMPVELSSILVKLGMLRKRLSDLASPVVMAKEYLANWKTELDNLQVDDMPVTEGAGDTVKVFRSSLNKTSKEIQKLDTVIANAHKPVLALDGKISHQIDTLREMLMPMWKAYYLQPAGRLFEPASWKTALNFFKSWTDVYRTRMVGEIPSSKATWGAIFFRFLTIAIPVALGIWILWRLAGRLSSPLPNGIKRICRNSLPWIGLGIACQYAAWLEDFHFPLLSIFSTIMLCIGQLTLAWDLCVFEQAETAPRRSILHSMLYPQVAGLFLLLLNFPAPTLGLLWIGVIIYCLRHEQNKGRKSESGLPRNLLMLHRHCMILALCMTVLGWGRLSILMCMLYAVLAVSIMQAVGVLHLSSLINDRLPTKGMSALYGGLAMALLVPAVLTVLTASSLLWGIAYPGFVTFLQHVSAMDISVGQKSFSVLQLVLILSVFYLCRSLATVGQHLIGEFASSARRFDSALIGPCQSGYTYLIWALFAFYVLKTLGFSLANLAMVAGGLSVGIGLGLQSAVSNFTSGLVLLFGHKVREGDWIEVSGKLVTVRRIDLLYTQVETPDNALIFVPNGDLLSKELTNWTRNGRCARKQLAVGVAYGSDIQLVTKLLYDIALAHPRILHKGSRMPRVALNDFGSSTLDFLLYLWVDDISIGDSILNDLRIEIERRFREANIEIAFPQLEIHMITPTPTMLPERLAPQAPTASV